MAYAVPKYAIGKHITMQITPQVVATDGTFSNHAIGALTLNARLDMDDQRLSLTTDNISPRDVEHSNPVVYESGSTFTITEIAQSWPLWSNGATVWGQGNTLEKAARLARYHLLQITALKDDNTTSHYWTAYVLLIDHGRNSPKAKNTYSATFQTVIVADTSTGLVQGNPTIG